LNWSIAWPYRIFISLNLIGLLVGIQQGLTIGTIENSMYLMCLTWAIFNLLLLVSAVALEKESQHLKWHTHQQLRQAAMIQLPSGRTITGITENFPAISLTVSLPIRPEVEIGTMINLSIFQGQKESNFAAKICINSDECFRVTIVENSRDSYQALGTIVLSRGENWPKWLPGRDADQPIPVWLSKPFMTALDKVAVIAEKLGLPSKVNLLASWIKYWKKTT